MGNPNVSQYRRWINISGRSGPRLQRLDLSAGGRDRLSRGASGASAAPAPRRAPAHVGTRASRTVAAGFAAAVRIPRSSRAGRSRHRKKIGSDNPRCLWNCFLLLWFPLSDARPVAKALPVPFFSASHRSPISLPRLPLRPHPRRLPAAVAAIALPRLPGAKALLTSFEQTPAPPRVAAGQPLPPPGLLIFGMACRILGKAHGR